MKKIETREELQIKVNQLEAKIAEIEDTESKSSACLENSPVCTKIVDLDFNLQYMSNAGVSALQIDDVSSLYGKPYPFTFFPPAYNKAMNENLLLAKQTGETIIQEGEVLDVKGNPLWFEASITPVYNKQGEMDHLLVISIDTWARKQTEDALRNNEMRLQNMFESMNEGFSIQDVICDESGKPIDLRFVEANSAFESQTGLKNSETLGHTLLELFPTSEKYWIERYGQVGITGESISFEANFGPLNIFYRVNAFQTKYCQFGVLFTDINDQKVHEIELIKAKERAEESEIRFRAFMNASNDLTFIKDDHFRYLFANEETARLFNTTTTEIIGKTDKELSQQIDISPCQSSDIRALDSNEQFTIEEQLGNRIFEVTKIPLKLPDNKKGVGGIMKDITERVASEKSLKESEEYFRALIENSSDVISILNKKGIITYESPSHKKVLGYEIGKLIGENVFGLVHPDDRERIFIQFSKLLEKPNGIEHVNFRFLRKDGTWIYIEGTGTNLLDSPKIKGIVVNYRDISEQKTAEEKIRVTERNLQNTFDLSPSIIAKANMNLGFFIQANKAVTKILGYTIDEFISKPYMEFVHPDDRQSTIDIATEQLKGNDVTFFENRYLCKDGSYKWLAWHGTKPDKHGIVTTIGSDINARKIIEQEIVKTKQFYENVIEGVQDGIWVTDENDVIYYANSAMEKIAGVPREKIQGNNILKDFHEETTGELKKYYKQAREEKRPVWYNIKVRTPSKKDTQQNGWLIPQYQNQVFTGIICTIRDITERSKAEGNVRKLSTAVEQSPSVIVTTNTEGILEYVNPTFIEITGYSSAEAIGKKSNILKSGEQDDSFYEAMWETINSGKVWRGQFHNKKKNGELFWEAASISAILNKAGEVINYIKIGEDITQQKINEAELKTALEKALESDRLKSAFLANMSHEIRTPMNGIIGFINLLNQPNLSKDKIGKYSGIINKSGNRLLSTINDIIDISKIEAGEMQVSKTEISINVLMNEIYAFHLEEANNKGLSLNLESTNSTDLVTVYSDNHKLHGILTNLVKNAIKYTEKGSITFGFLLNDNCIDFFVEDTGIGISKDRINAIFNRFEQADIEDKKALQGSGLGLTIAKAYTEMLGGEISVTSVESKGSKFTFTIPHSNT